MTVQCGTVESEPCGMLEILLSRKIVTASHFNFKASTSTLQHRAFYPPHIPPPPNMNNNDTSRRMVTQPTFISFFCHCAPDNADINYHRIPRVRATFSGLSETNCLRTVTDEPGTRELTPLPSSPVFPSISSRLTIASTVDHHQMSANSHLPRFCN
jgi:hypothetical protein